MTLLTEKWELVPKHCVESNQEVIDRPKDNRSQKARWQFGEDFGPEVGTHRVHVVVRFSQENRSLVREDEDDILDSVETH
jgi:hypothetical protein